MMGDIFTTKSARPMLIHGESAPFDDPDFIFELKLDGDRCLAYLDQRNVTLISRRDHDVTEHFPELLEIGRQVKGRCILDGEVLVMQNGRSDFQALRKRFMVGNAYKLEAAMRETPVSLVVYDILYLKGKELTSLPLAERKEILAASMDESERFSLSRYISEQGRAFFELIKERELEGLIAKKLNSVYQMGKRSRDWLKIKNILDDDFVICGYIIKPAAYVASLVLGQYDAQNQMLYKGRVTLGLKTKDFAVIRRQPVVPLPPFPTKPPKETAEAVWLYPSLVCTVKFLQRTPQGGIRHASYKGLRQDKAAQEVLEYQA